MVPVPSTSDLLSSGHRGTPSRWREVSGHRGHYGQEVDSVRGIYGAHENAEVSESDAHIRRRLPTSSVGVGERGREKTRVNGVCRCVVNDLQSFLVLVSPTGRISLLDRTRRVMLFDRRATCTALETPYQLWGLVNVSM